MNKFETVSGRKSLEDKILLYYGHAVTFEDVALMCLFFVENEERLYPQKNGFKGGELFKEYIAKTFITGEVPKDSKYKPKK